MLSLQEISDRLEIQQLLVDYSTAIDQRRFDDLDAVFTPDAYIDYRVTGGIDGHYPQVKAWLAEVLPNFPAYSHMLGNFDVRIDGDTATVADDLLQPDGVQRRAEADPVHRHLVRGRIGPHRRRLADDAARRGEMLRQDSEG